MRDQPNLCKTLLLLSCVVLAAMLGISCGGTQTDEAGARGGGWVLQSAEGLSVELVELGKGADASGAGALLRIGGSSSEIDSLALAHRVVRDGKSTRYVMRFSGGEFTTLINEGGPKGSWTLFLPERAGEGIPLSVGEDATKNFSAEELVQAHAELKKAGHLARIEEFDRKAVEAREQRALVEPAAALKEKCEADLPVEVNWKSLPDNALKQIRVAERCAPVLSALGTLCAQSPSLKAFVKSGQIARIRCTMSKGEAQVALTDKRLNWAFAQSFKDGPEEGGTEAAQAAAIEGLKKLPAGEVSSIGHLMSLDATFMCLHEKSGKYVVFAPLGSDFSGVSFGDGTEFLTVATPAQTGPGWFFDPRFFNEKNPADHNGLDLRAYSRIEINPANSLCRVVCGNKRKSLTLVATEDARGFLSTASFKPAPAPPRPHALARDAQGTFYLVTAVEGENGATYTVHAGVPGRMKPIAGMKASVTPETEVYAGKAGTLRIDRAQKQASFTAGKKVTPLLLLPNEDNAETIYNQLAVFAGQRMYTPCDDL